MSLTIVRAAQEIENCDDFHVARILLLLQASAGRSDKPVKGIMKLAKLDFLVRYPSGLVRVLEKLKRQKQADEIRAQEGETIEAKMIRFRFGPWDERYRRWIGIMSAKGLANTFVEGRTVNVKLTPLGVSVAIDLVKAPEFEAIAKRAKFVASSVGDIPATRLKDFIYDVFPELTSMRWGSNIETL
jgi:hypothetical protein